MAVIVPAIFMIHPAAAGAQDNKGVSDLMGLIRTTSGLDIKLDDVGEYVKERLLDMSGVKLKFSGKGGEAEVEGHDAVLFEAFGTNKIFYARFVV